MEYSKIIESKLIDFDKLKKGDTLWSVTHGEVEITELRKSPKWIITNNSEKYYSGGRYYYRDKYPTLFSANPFENLVEPLDSNCGEFAVIKNQPLESVEAEAERQSENYGFPNTYKKAFKAGAEYAQNITIKN